MPYTLDDFVQDMNVMGEVNSSEWDVVPGPLLEPGMHAEYAPQVKPLMRVLNYFVDRYGKVEGGDYSYRFIIIRGFISRYRAKLIKTGAVKPSPTGDEISTSFLDSILAGFVDPTPPVMFAKHRDFNRNRELSYKKVMDRYVQEKREPNNPQGM